MKNGQFSRSTDTPFSDIASKLRHAALHYQTGALEKASQLYQEIIHANPQHPDALHMLGIISHQTGRHDLAIDLIRRAISSDSEQASFYFNLGRIFQHQGQVSDADHCYQKVLQLEPDCAEAHNNKGILLKRQGKLAEAAKCFRRALHINPNFADALCNLGNIYRDNNELHRAIACYEKAVDIHPDHVNAHLSLGRAYKRLGDWEKGHTCLQKAVALEPKRALPHCELGNLFKAQKKWNDAIEHYRKAIELRPTFAEAIFNMGIACGELNQLERAIKCYLRVIEVKPDSAEAYFNLGIINGKKNNLNKSVRFFKDAIELKPDYAEAYNNLGNTLKGQGKVDQAINYLRKAIKYDPDLAEAHLNLSLALLLKGNFSEGWQEYEWRFKVRKYRGEHRTYDKPEWDGSPFGGKRLLIHDEQGFGDTIQFVRYIPLVKQLGGTVIFETRQPILPLFKNYAGIDCLTEMRQDGKPSSDFDFFVPLLSIPGKLYSQIKDIPCSIPYLRAEPEKIEYWKDQIDGPGLKIGIVWAGRPVEENEPAELRNRSCRLEDFDVLAKIPNTRLFGLQKGDAADQISGLPPSFQIQNLGEDFDDFSDTAAAIENLDLVISIDTSVAHLAGALGKPVWVLLQHVADWRWLTGRDDNPWYASMRLFRQKQAGDWESVFGQVERDLRKLAGSYREFRYS